MKLQVGRVLVEKRGGDDVECSDEKLRTIGRSKQVLQRRTEEEVQSAIHRSIYLYVNIYIYIHIILEERGGDDVECSDEKFRSVRCSEKVLRITKKTGRIYIYKHIHIYRVKGALCA